jgi:hypothetical protein
MGKGREPQIILKTDQRKVVLELSLGGKFEAESSGWGENRSFLEGDDLEVAVRNGRRVLTHVPAGPRPALRELSLLSGTTIAGSKRSACLLWSENKPSSAGFCSAFDFRGRSARRLARRIPFDLRAIQCDVAEFEQPCCLAQLQYL